MLNGKLLLNIQFIYMEPNNLYSQYACRSWTFLAHVWFKVYSCRSTWRQVEGIFFGVSPAS